MKAKSRIIVFDTTHALETSFFCSLTTTFSCV